MNHPRLHGPEPESPPEFGTTGTVRGQGRSAAIQPRDEVVPIRELRPWYSWRAIDLAGHPRPVSTPTEAGRAVRRIALATESSDADRHTRRRARARNPAWTPPTEAVRAIAQADERVATKADIATLRSGCAGCSASSRRSCSRWRGVSSACCSRGRLAPMVRAPTRTGGELRVVWSTDCPLSLTHARRTARPRLAHRHRAERATNTPSATTRATSVRSSIRA